MLRSPFCHSISFIANPIVRTSLFYSLRPLKILKTLRNQNSLYSTLVPRSAHVDVAGKEKWSASYIFLTDVRLMLAVKPIIFHICCIKTMDTGDIQPSEWKVTLVCCIWTPESFLNLTRPLNWILTKSWLRRWYAVGWAVSSECATAVCLNSAGTPCNQSLPSQLLRWQVRPC